MDVDVDVDIEIFEIASVYLFSRGVMEVIFGLNRF